jgi:hypothetical protein
MMIVMMIVMMMAHGQRWLVGIASDNTTTLTYNAQ